MTGTSDRARWLPRSVAMMLAVGLAIPALVHDNASADARAKAPASAGPSLRVEAAKGRLLIGSGAINPAYLDEPRFGEVLAEQFNSLSPENELKWSFIEPQSGVFDFTQIDRLVAFARQHRMAVKGHGFISGCCNPDWLTQTTDPAQLRAAMKTHFGTIMKRYRGKVDRWDVVTEPLSTFGGTGLDPNHFYQVLGPDYIAEAFRMAHAADPKAKLFLNESLVEFYPAKRQELYDLVSNLVGQGVPISGVGLETHETLVAPDPGVITDIVKSYKALGLDVAITEMDVHVLDDTQPQIYERVITEALNAGVRDISFWGFTDKHAYTWLPGAKPLLFDEQYNPKPAFFAVWGALNKFVDKRAPKIVITTPAQGAAYIRNESVTVAYACTDEAGGSGVASCAGDLATGAALDTSVVGPARLSVTGADAAGNSATATATYSVVTAQTGLRSVEQKVGVLVKNGDLKAGPALALTGLLEVAVNQLDKGNTANAVVTLNSAVAFVQQLVKSGQLSAGNGQALINEMTRVRSTLR